MPTSLYLGDRTIFIGRWNGGFSEWTLKNCVSSPVLAFLQEPQPSSIIQNIWHDPPPHPHVILTSHNFQAKDINCMLILVSIQTK
jgi:hypothetical protein